MILCTALRHMGTPTWLTGMEAHISPQDQRVLNERPILEPLFRMEAPSDEGLMVTH